MTPHSQSRFVTGSPGAVSGSGTRPWSATVAPRGGFDLTGASYAIAAAVDVAAWVVAARALPRGTLPGSG
jgi:hypothetical protein